MLLALNTSQSNGAGAILTSVQMAPSSFGLICASPCVLMCQMCFVDFVGFFFLPTHPLKVTCLYPKSTDSAGFVDVYIEIYQSTAPVQIPVSMWLLERNGTVLNVSFKCCFSVILPKQPRTDTRTRVIVSFLDVTTGWRIIYRHGHRHRLVSGTIVAGLWWKAIGTNHVLVFCFLVLPRAKQPIMN